MAPLSISPLPQLYYDFKMDSAEWYVDWAMRLLSMTCYVIATVHLSIHNIKNKYYFVPMHIFSTNTVHNCIQLKLSLPNEMTMSRICISNVSCGSCEIVTVVPLVGRLPVHIICCFILWFWVSYCFMHNRSITMQFGT